MAENRIKDGERWQLRHAAGSYWLLDMEQEHAGQRPPLSLNQAGAELWRLFRKGAESGEAADMLCRLYQIDRESAQEDVGEFLAALQKQGIVIE